LLRFGSHLGGFQNFGRRPEPEEQPLQPGAFVGHQYDLQPDRKSTRLNSSHQIISYAVFCLKKKKKKDEKVNSIN